MGRDLSLADWSVVVDVVEWARLREVSVFFKYHENTDMWSLETWSPAKRECLVTKESTTIEIAFARLRDQWVEVTEVQNDASS